MSIVTGTVEDIQFSISVDDLPIAARIHLRNNPDADFILLFPDEAEFDNLHEWAMYYEPDEEDDGEDKLVICIPELTAEDLMILGKVLLNNDLDIVFVDEDDEEIDPGFGYDYNDN